MHLMRSASEQQSTESSTNPRCLSIMQPTPASHFDPSQPSHRERAPRGLDRTPGNRSAASSNRSSETKRPARKAAEKVSSLSHPAFQAQLAQFWAEQRPRHWLLRSGCFVLRSRAGTSYQRLRLQWFWAAADRQSQDSQCSPRDRIVLRCRCPRRPYSRYPAFPAPPDEPWPGWWSGSRSRFPAAGCSAVPWASPRAPRSDHPAKHGDPQAFPARLQRRGQVRRRWKQVQALRWPERRPAPSRKGQEGRGPCPDRRRLRQGTIPPPWPARGYQTSCASISSPPCEDLRFNARVQILFNGTVRPAEVSRLLISFTTLGRVTWLPP